jgi:NitT/TauT family transport system substrate-binding protein
MSNKKIYLVAVIIVLVAICGFLYEKRANNLSANHTGFLEKVRVQTGWIINGEVANICSAIVNGYYRDEGLDVDLLPGGPTGASFIIATNAIAQDPTLTLGVDGDLVPLVRGRAKSNEEGRLRVKAFAAFWNENPYGFMVRSDSGLNSIKDFIKRKPNGGKYKIGVTADSVIQFAIAKYLGISVGDLDIIIVGFDAAPLLTKQVDAIAGYWTTQAYELEKAGISYKFLNASELPGFSQPSMIAMATEKVLSEKQITLKKWLRATIKGLEFVKNNPEKAAEQIIDARCGGPTLNKDQELWIIKKSIPLFDSLKPGWIYEPQVTGFAKAYNLLGQIPVVPKAEDMIDYSILRSIY